MLLSCRGKRVESETLKCGISRLADVKCVIVGIKCLIVGIGCEIMGTVGV